MTSQVPSGSTQQSIHEMKSNLINSTQNPHADYDQRAVYEDKCWLQCIGKYVGNFGASQSLHQMPKSVWTTIKLKVGFLAGVITMDATDFYKHIMKVLVHHWWKRIPNDGDYVGEFSVL